LRGQKRYRNLLLFIVGINTALRISDLLQLQVSHFLEEQNRIGRRFWIKERKRGKRHEVVINTSIREVLDEYLVAFPDIGETRNNYIFFSSTRNDYSIPIKRGQAWKFITSICHQAGVLAGLYPIRTFQVE
jgi:integrase